MSFVLLFVYVCVFVFGGFFFFFGGGGIFTVLDLPPAPAARNFVLVFVSRLQPYITTCSFWCFSLDFLVVLFVLVLLFSCLLWGFGGGAVFIVCCWGGGGGDQKY